MSSPSLSRPPKPCRNCGQIPLPGAPYCTYCGAPQFASAPAGGISCLFAVLGALGAAALFVVVIFSLSGLVSSNVVSWQTLLLLALLVCGLVGGVSLQPHFPGMVRGLGLGLLIGGVICAVLLGGLLSCLEGLKNI